MRDWTSGQAGWQGSVGTQKQAGVQGTAQSTVARTGAMFLSLETLFIMEYVLAANQKNLFRP